jgi:hypothetical protein
MNLSNTVKIENGDVLADFHNILSKWKNYFSKLLNVHRVTDLGTFLAEPLVPDSSPFEVEIATAKLKKYTSPGSDQTPAELIQAGGETLQSEIHKLFNSIWNKNCLISGRGLLMYQFTRRAIKLTVVIIVGYHYYNKLYLISFSHG